jgi:hypothetical protein
VIFVTPATGFGYFNTVLLSKGGPMDKDRFFPLWEAVKNPVNLVLLVLGTCLLIDFLTGCPIMQKIITLQMKFMHIDPNQAGFKFVSFFGTFTDLVSIARAYDKFGIVIFLVTPAFAVFMALLGAVGRK